MQIFHNANYDFIKYRWPALIGSLIIIWIGVASIYLKGGIPKGIDFTGGANLTGVTATGATFAQARMFPVER